MQTITSKLQSYPHGLVSLLRLQNMTKNKFDFERIITTQLTGYSINSKMLMWTILDNTDVDDDEHISVREIVNSLLALLRVLDLNLPTETRENIYVYVTMLETSVKSLLTKYALTDISQCKRACD